MVMRKVLHNSPEKTPTRATYEMIESRQEDFMMMIHMHHLRVYLEDTTTFPASTDLQDKLTFAPVI